MLTFSSKEDKYVYLKREQYLIENSNKKFNGQCDPP